MTFKDGGTNMKKSNIDTNNTTDSLSSSSSHLKIEEPKNILLKELGFKYIPELNQYFKEVGHLQIILENNTLGLFDGDYMEIGNVTESELKSFTYLLQRIIEDE